MRRSENLSNNRMLPAATSAIVVFSVPDVRNLR